MNTGSYSTNLISSDLSYPMDYDAAHLENMELPTFYCVRKLDNNPPLDELPPLDDAPCCWKGEKRTKKINVEEDKLLVSAWLNVSQDAIQGADQAKGTY
jgi:hypothetical protein